MNNEFDLINYVAFEIIHNHQPFVTSLSNKFKKTKIPDWFACENFDRKMTIM